MCFNRLFHYTDYEGYRSIRRQKVILQSRQSLRDAILGSGVYLTKMSPWHYSKAQIAKNNWLDSSATHKVAYVIIVTFSDDEPGLRRGSKDGRDIWVYKGDLDLGQWFLTFLGWQIPNM